MNVQDYRAAGYVMSNLIEQAAVTRAEKDAVAAYILPLIGHVPTQAESEAEPLKTAIMALSFLLLQQRSIAATRAGAKTKLTAQSGTPTWQDVLRENAPVCVNALRAIAGDQNPEQVCSDICGLFFRTHFFGTN